MTADRKKTYRKTLPIPTFSSLEEEADFWDTHCSLDYGRWTEVRGPYVRRHPPLRKRLVISMTDRAFLRLQAAARSRETYRAALARKWIMGRLEREK
jgi:hypothetical protein